MLNIKAVHGIAHLVQKLRDSEPYITFDEMTQYLRENSKTIEGAPGTSSKKRIMNTTGDHDDGLTAQETMELFDTVAKDS